MKFSFTAPLIAAFALLSSSSYTVEGKISGKTNKRSAVEEKVSVVKAKVNADALAEAYEEMGSDRWMKPNRALSDATPHETIYEHIIGSEDNVYIPGFGGDSTVGELLGAVFYTSGGIYPNGSVQKSARIAPNGALFAGDKQPVKFPAARSNFFITGECTVTQASSDFIITGHSCLYTLCLGGGGNNCVNGLAAGPFVFNLQGTTTDGDRTFPNLPPIFSGIILGGTGACAGIKGTFSVQTAGGQTAFNLNEPQFGLINQRFTFNTNKKLPEAPGPQKLVSNVAGSFTLSPTAATPSPVASF